MPEVRTVTSFICDWTDEYGDICGERIDVSASQAGASSAWGHAQDLGWGSYSNNYVRRSRWTTGARLIFCPIHATTFRNNHGWGGLEDYEPPRRWWESYFRRSK